MADTATAVTDPAQALREYDDTLAAKLADLVADVAEAAVDDDADDAAMVVFSWYRSALLPLLKVDEGDLLPVGRRSAPALAELLTALQAQLRGYFEELDAPDDAIAAAMLAARAEAGFAAYAAARGAFAGAMVARELGVIVGAHPELTGGAPTAPAAAPRQADPNAPKATALEPISGTEDLDVRSLSHQARHGVILAKMQALTETGRLVLVNDHDPLPLKYQAEAMWPDQFDWDYLEEGPVEWRVAISRV